MHPEYSVKQDPMTRCIAQRTVFPEDSDKAWLVYRLDGLSHFVEAKDVAMWDDMVAVVPEGDHPATKRTPKRTSKRG